MFARKQLNRKPELIERTYIMKHREWNQGQWLQLIIVTLHSSVDLRSWKWVETVIGEKTVKVTRRNHDVQIHCRPIISVSWKCFYWNVYLRFWSDVSWAWTITQARVSTRRNRKFVIVTKTEDVLLQFFCGIRNFV